MWDLSYSRRRFYNETSSSEVAAAISMSFWVVSFKNVFKYLLVKALFLFHRFIFYQFFIVMFVLNADNVCVGLLENCWER